MKSRIGWLAIAAVMVSFCCGGAMVFANVVPSDRIGADGRVSLRDESRAGRGSFFVGYGSSRGHRGGGLHGGK